MRTTNYCRLREQHQHQHQQQALTVDPQLVDCLHKLLVHLDTPHHPGLLVGSTLLLTRLQQSKCAVQCSAAAAGVMHR
jgi:hypothetical protein